MISAASAWPHLELRPGRAEKELRQHLRALFVTLHAAWLSRAWALHPLAAFRDWRGRVPDGSWNPCQYTGPALS